MQYKYKLNHLLSLLPAGIYPENVIAHLELAYQISSPVFYHDRYILNEDEEEIPHDRLLAYAQVFRVRIDELRNAKVAVI